MLARLYRPFPLLFDCVVAEFSEYCYGVVAVVEGCFFGVGTDSCVCLHGGYAFAHAEEGVAADLVDVTG